MLHAPPYIIFLDLIILKLFSELWGFHSCAFGNPLKMKAPRSFETSRTTHPTTKHNIPEERKIQLYIHCVKTIQTSTAIFRLINQSHIQVRHTKSKQDRQCTYNVTHYYHYHYCRGKAISITSLRMYACSRSCVCPGAWASARACVHVALLIQHATRMRHIVTSFVAAQSPPNFSTLSHKRHDFRKK